MKKEKIKDMVDKIVRMSSQQSSEGNYHVSYDEMSQLFSIPKEELIKAHEQIIEEVDSHLLILSETWTDTDENGNPEGVDMNFCWNDNNDLPVWNRKDSTINLLEQDIRCCDEITEEEESFSFTYELWFDVDSYFGTQTKDYDDTWINFYTMYYPETKSVEAIMCIDTDGSNETYSWQLTEAEKEFLLSLMKNYAEQKGITIETVKKAIFETKIAADEKHNGEIVSVYEHNGCQYRVVFPDETEAWAYESELSFIKGENNE